MHQTIALTIFIELILDKRSGSMTGWLWRRSLPSSSRVSLPIASRTSRESRRHCLPTITLTSMTLDSLFDLAHRITLCCVIALFKPWPSHSSKYIKQDAISWRSRDSPNTRGLDKKWSLMERCRVGRRSPQMPPATRLVRVTPHHGLRPPGSKQRTSSNRRLRRWHGSDLLDNTGHKANFPCPYNLLLCCTKSSIISVHNIHNVTWEYIWLFNGQGSSSMWGCMRCNRGLIQWQIHYSAWDS